MLSKLIDQGLLVEETENPSSDLVVTQVKLAMACEVSSAYLL